MTEPESRHRIPEGERPEGCILEPQGEAVLVILPRRALPPGVLCIALGAPLALAAWGLHQDRNFLLGLVGLGLEGLFLVAFARQMLSRRCVFLDRDFVRLGRYEWGREKPEMTIPARRLREVRVIHKPPKGAMLLFEGPGLIKTAAAGLPRSALQWLAQTIREIVELSG